MGGGRRRREGSEGGHTSFSPTTTSKILPRGITCAISPKATVSLLPLTNFTLSASITSGLLPVCLNLANSALSDSRIRSIAASKAEKSSGSTSSAGSFLLLVVGPFAPFSEAVLVVVWGCALSFFLRSGADEVRGWWWRSGGQKGEGKGGGRLGRRRHAEGWRGRMRAIRVLAGWGVSILVKHGY